MASKYIQKFPVPEGFPEILHDLSKEILRNQPEDIIEFSAYYFKCLQENLVLDYQKKGKNIPCDFQSTVPKTSTKEELNTGKKKITREDEEDHLKAFDKSHMKVNDAARVIVKESKVKEDKKEDVILNEDKDKEVILNSDNMENNELKGSSEMSRKSLISLSNSFVDEVMTKKIDDYHTNKNYVNTNDNVEKEE